MFVDLGVRDFLDRAALVHPDRVAVVDEPDPPAGSSAPSAPPPGLSWGSLTYRDVDRLARAHAAVLDRLGVPVGARVAVVGEDRP